MIWFDLSVYGQFNLDHNDNFLERNDPLLSDDEIDRMIANPPTVNTIALFLTI